MVFQDLSEERTDCRSEQEERRPEDILPPVRVGRFGLVSDTCGAETLAHRIPLPADSRPRGSLFRGLCR